MEYYVITMKKQEDNSTNTVILGIFENKQDVWNLLIRYYNENEDNFDKLSLYQFENNEGCWEMQVVGRKGNIIRTIEGKNIHETRDITSLKKLIDKW